MASYYHATVEEFLAETNEHVLARLTTGAANRGYTSQYSDQILSWERDLGSLRATLERCASLSSEARTWGLILEFFIPKRDLRIDIVLLIRQEIVIVEAKTGLAGGQASRQIEEYALLLHYFHKGSNQRDAPVGPRPAAAAPSGLRPCCPPACGAPR